MIFFLSNHFLLLKIEYDSLVSGLAHIQGAAVQLHAGLTGEEDVDPTRIGLIRRLEAMTM